ncbi:MAG: histidine phosphatase family protein [Bacillaceae bacterium]|nr:histidine phosphatase family protein [Bacillaceae bacterium]
MKLYLIRHGQSTANHQGIIQGCKDFPLSELGNIQAGLVGEFLANQKFDAIYSSDLTRAYDTAFEVSKHQNLPIEKWEKLREVNLGPLEGKTKREMEQEFPQVKDASSILTTGLEGTETIDQITERCQDVLQHLFQMHKHLSHDVALVSHGGFISIFLMYLMFGEQWNEAHRPFVVGNTGVTKVEFTREDKPVFHYINRDTHLYKAGAKPTSTILY